MTAYRNDPQYLSDLLHILDLHLAGLLAASKPERGFNKFAGLTLTREEAEAALSDAYREWCQGKAARAPWRTSARKAEAVIAKRLHATVQSGNAPALFLLAQRLSLTRFELNTLVCAIAPAWKPHYHKLFGFLQNELGAIQPRVELCLDLFTEGDEERAACLGAFSPNAPLFRFQLLRMNEAGPSCPLKRELNIDDHLLRLVLGAASLDPHLLPFCSLEEPSQNQKHPSLDEDLAARLSVNEDLPRVIHLHGPRGAGKKDLARHIAFRNHWPLILVDLEGFRALCPHPEETLARLQREASLQRALIFFEQRTGEKEALLSGNCKHARALLFFLKESASRVLIAAQRPLPLESLQPCQLARLALHPPDFKARCAHWRSAMEETGDEIPTEELADRFPLTPGLIGEAVQRARQIAALAGRPLAAEDCFAACRELSRTGLEDLALKVEPLYGWEDIVLPEDAMAHLLEIRDQMACRRRVYGAWNLRHKLAGGKGLVVLFTGPPGTGKTMAAEIIAGQLGLDLYRIDLSALVSKYIGETEKNLERLFRQARNANAVLFFDEADALFGKRGEQKDAHDRYANLEVSYLLQRLENYEGMAVLASNLARNIDEAFVRRLRHIVRFPFPDAALRREIWRRSFPPELPLAPRLDLDFIAKRFELSGGSIRNASVNAAFLAARGECLDMRHLVRAIRREYQKMGRLCLKDDFGPYFRHIEEGAAKGVGGAA